MGSDVKSILIIDVSPLVEKSDDPKMAEDERVREVVRQLDEACKVAGFFYVKGHGVPDSLVKEAREVTRKFFDLPYEKKLKIKLLSTTGYRGYQIMGENLTSGNPDFHEAINCYKEVEPGEFGSLGGPLEGSNLWPDTPSNFKSVMEQYTSNMKELGRKIMRGLALALGGPVEAFEGDIAGDAFWMMRLIGYPGLSESQRSEIKISDVGCGAHTDDGEEPIGQWVNATPIPGTFVCLLGEMVKILSYGIYEATVHRVYNSSPKYRVSIAFFYEMTFDKHIESFNFCVQKTSGVAKCKGAVYGKLLAEYVAARLIVDE